MHLDDVINFNKIVNTHLLVQIAFHQFDATTEKNKEIRVTNTQAPKNSQFLSRPKRACEETNVTFWYKECSILTFDFWNSFIDV